MTAGNSSRGGAIRLKNGGRASATHVAFIGNSAFFGGAIATESGADRLTVRGSGFIANEAGASGGAVAMDGGVVDISESAFRDNQARERGGAIAALRGRALISNSTVSGGKALRGGGIYVADGAATLTHLTLANNEAAHVLGAGLYVSRGEVRLRNSIVAGSGGGDDCSGSLAQKRGNFSEDGRCSQQAGGDPLLAALVETPAHFPLLDASPAHGAGDPAFCLPTDQLGNPRPHCDIGAIESARDPEYAAEPRAETAAACALADQIIAANTDAASGSCPAGESLDVIRLRRNITLDAPLPPITSDLAIDGNGYTISGNDRFRIFEIEAGQVVIKAIRLVRGVNLREEPGGYGGAITLRNSAELVVSSAELRENRARYGGAIASVDASRLLVLESDFYDNEALRKGGAIWRDGACGSINHINFVGNRAGELPGANMDDYLAHIGGASLACVEGPEFYRLSAS